MIRKMFLIALILVLAVNACSAPQGNVAPEPTLVSTILPSALPDAPPGQTPQPAATPSNLTVTPASISDAHLGAAITAVQKEPRVRLHAEAEYILAEVGMTLQTGGGVQTGAGSRSTLRLLSSGTIIRLGPNSSFVVQELGSGGQPKTSLELFFGKIWILLKGGELEVTTPSGVASVRGSLLGVSYDPQKKSLSASCLEGNCALEDEKGEIEELTDGEMAEVDETGEVSEAGPIPEEEVEEWVNENPDAEEFFPEPPEWLPEPDPDYFGDDGYEPIVEVDATPEVELELPPGENLEVPPETSPEAPPEEIPSDPSEEPPPEEIPEEPPEEPSEEPEPPPVEP